MSIVNKIGLEAEFLLRNAKGALVYPSSHGFTTDDFPILGEFRAEPGTTRAETLANFFKAYWETVFKARRAGLTIDLTGWASVSPKTHAAILRKQGTKHIAKAENAQGLDILELTDARVEDGKVREHLISCGLHIHFSSESVDVKKVGPVVSDASLKAILSDNIERRLGVYQDLAVKDNTVTVRASRICEPIISLIIRELDESVLPEYVKDLPKLKYRHPGFFERKPWGFEYRSLPFTQRVLANVDQIVEHAFDTLESLDRRPVYRKGKAVAKGVKAEVAAAPEENPEIAD